MKPTWSHLTFTKWCKICLTKFEANTPNEGFCRPECSEINRWFWKRNNNLKKLYGIDEERYRKMLREQDGRCKICRTNDPGADHLNFCIDHSHVSGQVRGLLCNLCNTKLRTLDDPEWNAKAQIYLQG